MPALFKVRLSRTVHASQSTGYIAAPGSGMRRAAIRGIDISFGTASDNTIQVQMQRISAIGTATGVTPSPHDPADTAANFVAGENSSAEPTYTAGLIFVDKGIYAKGLYREVLPPGAYYVIPATANAGFGVKTPTAPATPVIYVTSDVEQW